MQIAILAGEASGDRVAGQLARELRQLEPSATLWGTGGQHLRDAGAELVVDASQFGVVGLAAAVQMMPSILSARRQLLAALAQRKPDVVVAIDAGALHLGFGPIRGVLPWLRERLPQTRVLYYFPPGSWRRTLTKTPLGQLADAVATPFSWSERELSRLGVNATFVGHPLLDLAHPSAGIEQLSARFGLDLDRPIIGILPGSRRQEISAILPTQFDAAARIAARVPGVQFLLALAPTVDRQLVERELERAAARWDTSAPRAPSDNGSATATIGPEAVPVDGSSEEMLLRQRRWIEAAHRYQQQKTPFPQVGLIENATYDVMALSDLLLCTSGTATLEAAILGRPMIVIYKMSKANLIEYQFVKKRLPEFIGMPNLIAGKKICPELIQDAATPESIAAEAIDLLLDPSRLLQMRAALKETIAPLGEPGGAYRTAEMVLALAKQSQSARSSDG